MYKCTICKKEFEKKPDYCDCGNDEFIALEKENEKHIEKRKVTSNVIQDKKDKGELVSIAIFLLCIILSALFIFFFNGDDKNKKPKAPSNIQKEEIQAPIPDIDEIWIQTKTNTPDKISVLNPLVVTSKKEETKTVVIKPQEKIPSKSASNVAKKPQDRTQTVKEQTKKQSGAELKNYKIALRNLIASKINFTAIAGDGKCSATFQVSDTGKLINRSFVVLSSNDTLNDNVYSALLKTPSFSPPPSSYNNEKLKLSVSIYNGNFEVTLF